MLEEYHLPVRAVAQPGRNCRRPTHSVLSSLVQAFPSQSWQRCCPNHDHETIIRPWPGRLEPPSHSARLRRFRVEPRGLGQRRSGPSSQRTWRWRLGEPDPREFPGFEGSLVCGMSGSCTPWFLGFLPWSDGVSKEHWARGNCWSVTRVTGLGRRKYCRGSSGLPPYPSLCLSLVGGTLKSPRYSSSQEQARAARMMIWIRPKFAKLRSIDLTRLGK